MGKACSVSSECGYALMGRFDVIAIIEAPSLLAMGGVLFLNGASGSTIVADIFSHDVTDKTPSGVVGQGRRRAMAFILVTMISLIAKEKRTVRLPKATLHGQLSVGEVAG